MAASFVAGRLSVLPAGTRLGVVPLPSARAGPGSGRGTPRQGAAPRLVTASRPAGPLGPAAPHPLPVMLIPIRLPGSLSQDPRNRRRSEQRAEAGGSVRRFPALGGGFSSNLTA